MINGALTQHNPIDADSISHAFFNTLANLKLQWLDIAAPFFVTQKPPATSCNFL